MSKRVHIDEEECIGCGSCEEVCPEVFKLNEETDKAAVIKPEGGPEDLIEEAPWRYALWSASIGRNEQKERDQYA